jgi:hypothetical protein
MPFQKRTSESHYMKKLKDRNISPKEKEKIFQKYKIIKIEGFGSYRRKSNRKSRRKSNRKSRRKSNRKSRRKSKCSR